DALPPRRNNLPPAIVLPERLVHWSGGVIPGAYGGLMGRRHDPLFIEASPYGNPMWRGAYPQYTISNSSPDPPPTTHGPRFPTPQLHLVPRQDARPLECPPPPPPPPGPAAAKSGAPRDNPKLRRPPPVGHLAACRPSYPPRPRRDPRRHKYPGTLWPQ